MTEILARFLPLGLILLMFVVGLRLKPDALKVAFLRPAALALGLAVQVIGLPLVAFALAWIFALAGPMAAGLVLVAAAPGGVTSNYIALLARADLALSAAMTLVTTALASLTIPLVLVLAGVADLPGAGGLARISLMMAAIALGPMLLGMVLARLAPGGSARVGTVLEPVSRLVFIAMVLATFAQNWGPMVQNLTSVGPAVLALNLSALALAAAAAALAGLGAARRRAIMVEASLQNVAVALFVAGTLLGKPEMTVPALVYAVVMNASALVQIGLARRR